MCDEIDEYCIYLSNLGVIDSIESFLSIHKTEAELFLVAFRCFDNIISNSCSSFPLFFLSSGICREHIWDVSTLESLVAFMYESYSFPVALALLKLFSKVNEYGTFWFSAFDGF